MCIRDSPEFSNITPSQLDLPFLTKLVMFSHDCFSFHLNFKTNESRKNWKEYTKLELKTGGGRLFKFISKDDKSCLTVSLQMIGKGFSFCPNKIIKQQVQLWQALWDPTTNPNKLEQVRNVLEESRIIALNSPPPVVDIESFIHTIKTYNKNSRGVDSWTCTELKPVSYTHLTLPTILLV